MKVSRCGIHGFHETLGIDVDEVRFFWALESDDEDAVQTAYRILLSTSPDNLENANFAWDSSKVSSDVQRNVACQLEEGFQSTCSYYWRVTVWDQYDTPSHSTVQSFFTAYPRSNHLPPYSMNQTYMPHTSLIFRTWFEDAANRWKAVWIGDGGDKPLYVRKSFDLARKPSKAIALASGLGHFNLRANGREASDHVIDPGCKLQSCPFPNES